MYIKRIEFGGNDRRAVLQPENVQLVDEYEEWNTIRRNYNILLWVTITGDQAARLGYYLSFSKSRRHRYQVNTISI